MITDTPIKTVDQLNTTFSNSIILIKLNEFKSINSKYKIILA